MGVARSGAQKCGKIFQDVGLKSAVLPAPGLPSSSPLRVHGRLTVSVGCSLSLKRAQATFPQLNREEMIPWMRQDSTSCGRTCCRCPTFVVFDG